VDGPLVVLPNQVDGADSDSEDGGAKVGDLRDDHQIIGAGAAEKEEMSESEAESSGKEGQEAENGDEATAP